MINIRTIQPDHHIGLVFIMNEMAIQALAVKNEFNDLSKHTGTLALGLQNAALGEKGASNPTIEYLFAITEALQKFSEKCDEIIDPNSAPANNDVANRPKI